MEKYFGQSQVSVLVNCHRLRLQNLLAAPMSVHATLYHIDRRCRCTSRRGSNTGSLDPGKAGRSRILS